MRSFSKEIVAGEFTTSEQKRELFLRDFYESDGELPSSLIESVRRVTFFFLFE